MRWGVALRLIRLEENDKTDMTLDKLKVAGGLGCLALADCVYIPWQVRGRQVPLSNITSDFIIVEKYLALLAKLWTRMH